MNQFLFTLRFKDIFLHELRFKIRQAQFFAGFAQQGGENLLAEVHVSSDRRVPFSGLNVFPKRTPLQIEFAGWVEHVKMDDGVEQFAPAVAFAARGTADDVPIFIDKRKQFGRRLQKTAVAVTQEAEVVA